MATVDETRWLDGQCERCGAETFEQTSPSVAYCNGCRRRVVRGERETPAGWKDVAQIERMQAVIETYGFALITIVTADDDEHSDHEGCPGSVAATALETGKKILSGQA